jgi:hypothetical protein
MEGWRQRRLGSNGRNHRRKEQIDLTVSGLLMEGTKVIWNAALKNHRVGSVNFSAVIMPT